MINQARFGTIINLFLNIILCVSLSCYVLSHNGLLTLETFIVSFVSSFCIGYTIGDLVPGKMWGDKVAAALGLRANSLVAHFVSTILLAFVMVTSISFLANLVALGVNEHMIRAWLSLYPILWLGGYLLLLIFLPIGIKIAAALTSGHTSGPDHTHKPL